MLWRSHFLALPVTGRCQLLGLAMAWRRRPGHGNGIFPILPVLCYPGQLVLKTEVVILLVGSQSYRLCSFGLIHSCWRWSQTEIHDARIRCLVALGCLCFSIVSRGDIISSKRMVGKGPGNDCASRTFVEIHHRKTLKPISQNS
jgi:hypothetical protein